MKRDANYQKYIAEAFNTIRTNMGFLGMDKEMKCILVSSSVKGEGKTYISCNLAKAYASIHKKVLLIDCDLRNPAVGDALGIDKEKGLTELIISGEGADKKEDYSGYIFHYEENLDVIVAGFLPPNPAELLSSRRIEIILECLKKQYDIILLDTPPILMVSDALSLNKYADGILMVVKYGFTTREMIKQSAQVFRVAGIKPTACVFNEVPESRKRYLYNYSYYAGSDKKTASKSKNIKTKGENEKEARTTVGVDMRSRRTR
jgi:capsular exopolysaccharide synthesis family protein